MSVKGFRFNDVVHKYDYDSLDNIPTPDKTLTKDGEAADSKTVGDAITTLHHLVGTPLVASSAASMTDRTKIYVYTGSETGYVNGHWYYFDGTLWADGGVYNSTALETDKTLTVENAAADAKKTGDELDDLKSALNQISANVYTGLAFLEKSNYSFTAEKKVYYLRANFEVGKQYKITNNGTMSFSAWGVDTKSTSGENINNGNGIATESTVSFTFTNPHKYLGFYCTSAGTFDITLERNDSIVNQIEDIDDTLDEISYETYFVNKGIEKLNFTLESGTLNANGTNNDEARYQNGFRTPSFITLENSIAIRANENYRFTVVMFNDDETSSGTYQSSSDIGAPFYIPAGMKFKMAMNYLNYGYKSKDEILSNIFIDNNALTELSELPFGSGFSLGYLDDNGALVKYAAMCCSSDYIVFDKTMIIKTDNDYRFNVYYYDDNDDVIWNSHNLQYDLAVPAGQKFKIALRRVTIPSCENVFTITKYITAVPVLDNKPTFDWWKEIKGVAHGGYDQHAPFNTLVSFKMAIEAGLKYMETDLRFTSDNVPVLLHDATINSMTDDASGAIADMTYAQVSQYDFGSKFDESFAGVHICTLEELLKLCRDTQTYLYLEFKVTPSEEQYEIVKALIDENLGVDKITFLCVDYDLMRNVWSHFNNPRVVYIMTAEKVSNLASALAELNSFKINDNVVASVWIPSNNDWASIKVLHDNGFPIIAGTSDSDAVALTMPYYVSEFSGSVDYPKVLRENVLQ